MGRIYPFKLIIMTRKNADKLLSKFDSLLGYYSKNIDSKIHFIFVTLKDPFLAKADLDQIIYNNERIPFIIGDEKEFTIVAVFNNGYILSMKRIIELDDIKQFEDIVQELDYMRKEIL